MKRKYLLEDIKQMKKLNTILYKKYGNSKKNYNKQQVNYLIKSKNSSFFINFQECTIFSDFAEYHKRLYHKRELKAKLKQFYDYYLNYLNFFCRPVFRNFYYNSLLHYCYDVKADIFYKNNYKEVENNDIIEDGAEIIENNKKSNSASEQKENKNDSAIKEKIEKINILIFDKETRNKIDNSSVIISSIERLKEDELNMSYTKKLKVNDNSYITLRNNNENLLEFIKEIKFNKNIKNNKLNQEKENEDLLLNNSPSLNKIICNNNLSGEINLITNYLKNKRKIGIDKDKIKNIKITKNFSKNKKENKSIKTKDKDQELESINTLKNRKIKKLEINFKNYKSNLYNLFKNNFDNYKSKINKNNNSSKKNIEIYNSKNSNVNLDEKRLSLNNNIKKYRPKIIESKKNSFINTTDYYRNNLSNINNKSMKMKTINTNNITNHNKSSLNKKQLISYCKNNKKYNNTIIGKNIQIWRNSKKNSLNSIIYNTNNINSNNNYNLLKTYLKNCPNLKKINKSKSLLKEKTKTACHSTDQIKTFSVRLIKSYNKKNKYNNKILAFFSNFKNNFTRSNNVSINDKNKKNRTIISKKPLINKSHSNSIIKRNKDNNYSKKSSLGNKKEVNLNVNLNLHSIFININPNAIYHQNNINESLNNFNKKMELNNNIHNNYKINGKSTKIKKSKKIIKNDYYKNKTQSYKSRNKTKNKIQKSKNEIIKGVNSFIYTNNNLNSKNNKEEKEKILKRNYTTFKIKKEKEKISRNAKSKISLSLNKKNKIINNKKLEEKCMVKKIPKKIEN